MQKWISILLGGVVVAVTACHSETQKPPASTEIVNYNEYEPVAWTPDGKHILIKNRWWYTPANKIFTAIAPPPVTLKEADYWSLLPSPDSQRLLWVEERGKPMLVSSVQGSPTVVIAMPSWLYKKAGQQENSFNTPFWRNNTDIVVHQSDRHTDRRACGIFNIESQQWRRLPENACIRAGFHMVGLVDYLRDQTYLVNSGGEGCTSLDVVKIDFATLQQTDEEVLTSCSEIPSQVQYRDPEHVTLFFPCEIVDGPLGVECAEHSRGTALYS